MESARFGSRTACAHLRTHAGPPEAPEKLHVMYMLTWQAAMCLLLAYILHLLNMPSMPLASLTILPGPCLCGLQARFLAPIDICKR